jgi:predicted transglutaminase-like cysteine proteinase
MLFENDSRHCGTDHGKLRRPALPGLGFRQTVKNLALFLIAVLWLSSASAKGSIRLFGSVEFKGPLKALPQWSRIISAAPEELEYLSSCDAGRPDCLGAAQIWKEMLYRASSLSAVDQIRMVNKKINTWPYQSDKTNFGKSDYWATPFEFLTKSGDCEDFSIAKYYALRELGFKKSQLRIVILKDKIRQVTHSVLAVILNEKIFILDNLSDIAMEHKNYSHYIPQYSVNENNRWAHIMPSTK